MKISRIFFDCFAGMEVINPDWYVCLERNSRYFKNCSGAEDYERELSEFAAYYKEKEYEYEQLMMYYVYRYFLNAVNDSEILLKGENWCHRISHFKTSGYAVLA